MSKKEQNIILDKLNEMHSDLKKLTTETVPKLDKRIAVVETKTKIWSGMSGILGGCLAVITSRYMK